jgi:hypothetical protein
MLTLVRRTGGRSLRAKRVRPLTRRAVRWLGADGNPLRRRMDKWESAARITLLIAFLIAAPLLSPVVGHLTAMNGFREVRQEKSWREVTAVLTLPAPQRFYGYGSSGTFWVPARWRAPSGARRTGDVATRAGAPAGSPVSIWVTSAGRVTGRPPLTAGLVRVREVLAEAGIVAGLALVVMLMLGLLRLGLNRRRMTYWAVEWSCIGPRWTTRRWPKT